MVLEAALIGGASAHTIWSYNRENYRYDKEMRQKMEFTMLEFRKTQAGMWREDIRDMTGLTERKMDNYLIVNTLLLGMCLGLFAEGRLEPGTPPWLLHFYVLTLGGAFMYLLMSVWLAMHASIIAQSASVRILTQFVRLPVPTWEELEASRTYGRQFEDLSIKHMFKLPFLSRPENDAAMSSTDIRRRPSADSAMDGVSRRNSEADLLAEDSPDPWNEEQHGRARDIYELKAMPAALRRHVGIARRAALQYQSFDAFARVVMTFGINQFLHAICYYCLGHIAHRSGSPWPAWCVVLIVLFIAEKLIELDFTLTKREYMKVYLFIFGGPICVARALSLWSHKQANLEVMAWVCCGFMFHGLWLLNAMRMCGIATQDNGAVLPMRLRAVLYLDVFGWLGLDDDVDEGLGQIGSTLPSNTSDPFQRQVSVETHAQRFTHAELNAIEHECLRSGHGGLNRARSVAQRLQDRMWSRRRRAAESDAVKRVESVSGEIFSVPEHAFEPETYFQSHCDEQQPDDHPSKDPGKIFRLMTMCLIFFWIFGSAMPFGGMWHSMKEPKINHRVWNPIEHLKIEKPSLPQFHLRLPESVANDDEGLSWSWPGASAPPPKFMAKRSRAHDEEE